MWGKRKLLLIAGSVVIAIALGRWFLRPPDPLAMDADNVRRVEVRFEPWGEDVTRLPGVASEDRDAIAELVAVVRSGEETRDHKCSSRGTVTFQRSTGLPAELRFLPGHHPEWYEFRAAGKVYRVDRVEFVAAMRRVGVEVPSKCQ